MYNTVASTSPDSGSLAAALVFLVIGGLFALVFFVIPAVIAAWKLFKKAGQPGWAAIIPLYNFWVMTKVGGTEEWKFWVYLVASLAGLIPGIGGLFGIAALVMEILIIIGFAKRFDRGVGFWLLVYLLPIVGVFLVDKANFVGATSTDVPPTTPPAVPPTVPSTVPPTVPQATPAEPTPPTPPAPTV